MSGADSTTEVTPTGRYEDHSLSIAKLGIKPPKEATRTKTPKTCETSPWFPSGKGGLFRPQELHRQFVCQALSAPCRRSLGSEPFRPETPSGSSLGRQVVQHDLGAVPRKDLVFSFLAGKGRVPSYLDLHPVELCDPRAVCVVDGVLGDLFE